LIRVFVPSADRFGRPLDHDRIAARVERLLLGLTSGVTAIEGSGIWRNGSTSPLRERVRILECYLPSALTARVERGFLAQVRRVARWARQDALLVVINGAPILVRPDETAGGAR
jgi:hypothetical protein